MSARQRRTALLTAAVTGTAAAVTGMLTTLPARATTGCQVAYSIASQWGGGFGANVTITNLGDALNGWALTWNFANGQTVTQIWNGAVSQSGSAVTVTNVSYNGAVATNGTVSFGFNGTWNNATNAVPTNFALNGVACNGPVTTTAPGSPTPSASRTPSSSPTPSRSVSPPPPSSSASPVGGALYVSTSGSASAPGTLSSPTTLASAITRVAPGGTIYLRGGTYNFSSTVTIAAGNNGTSGALKNLYAYPGEKPLLNFSAMAESASNRGLELDGSYWHLYGLDVERAGDNGIFVGGSHNIIERTVTAYNRDTGVQISRISSSTPTSQWPAYNLVISSESHDNSDSGGENADGFAAKLTVGPGNVFQYDVSHNNIDDGWDLFTKTDTGPISPVTIEDSLAYNNGTLTNGTTNVNGDRNGFKLGGDGIPVNHTVLRNIAYRNGHSGFTYNSNPGSMTITSNVGIDNTDRNFSFDAGTSVFRGNTSCRGGSGSNDKVVGNVDSSNQFWMGSNGSRCSSYGGALHWSFASDGRLAVTFG